MSHWDEIAQGKAWWQSRAIWGGVIAAGSGIAAAAGTNIDPQIMSEGVGYVLGATAALGGIASIVGRIAASRSIGR